MTKKISSVCKIWPMDQSSHTNDLTTQLTSVSHNLHNNSGLLDRHWLTEKRVNDILTMMCCSCRQHRDSHWHVPSHGRCCLLHRTYSGRMEEDQLKALPCCQSDLRHKHTICVSLWQKNIGNKRCQTLPKIGLPPSKYKSLNTAAISYL